jgi:UDPglucose 6-dehydrogenase
MMERLYKPFVLNGYPIIFMDIASAELSKYAANAMLATRISFMNEIASLCEATGANVEMVRKGIGSDKRIGMSFLYAGAGYGGSCFPKDVKALAKTGKENNIKMRIVEAVEEVNEAQKEVVFHKLAKAFEGNLTGKTIAIWGLSFKPDTDDMREAPSLVVIEKLIDAGAIVKAFDPVAMEEAKRRLGDRINYCSNIYDAAKDSDAIALMTEWKQFRLPSWARLKDSMSGDVVVDGRNIYDKNELESEGFRYYAIGKN